ncbi:hypothetical protein DFH06DRAFT_1416894 [Mycena polygramma]|nr:hypothetical protein DFH06DRAFT_1416894 [Mycena polygramma]
MADDVGTSNGCYRHISYGGEVWCKRAQAKPSRPRPRPRPPSEIQTPLSGASQFGTPVGEVWKFQEHFNQAQLFVNSLSAPEKAHLVAGFSFELSHCDDPVVAYTKLLNHIDFDLATAVATNVGGVVPSERLRPNPGKTAFGLSQHQTFYKKLDCT